MLKIGLNDESSLSKPTTILNEAKLMSEAASKPNFTETVLIKRNH